jgi:type IV pilus assembly protein PilV
MRGNQRGFTLIEFLVALVILSVGLLGLLQTVNLAMEKSLDSIFRTEAVILADEWMMEKRAMAFLSLTSARNYAVTRNVRGINKNYSVQENLTPLTLRSKEYIINVTWTSKNKTYSHSISSGISAF